MGELEVARGMVEKGVGELEEFEVKEYQRKNCLKGEFFVIL